jgi:hypothetical protein
VKARKLETLLLLPLTALIGKAAVYNRKPWPIIAISRRAITKPKIDHFMLTWIRREKKGIDAFWKWSFNDLFIHPSGPSPLRPKERSIRIRVKANIS